MKKLYGVMAMFGIGALALALNAGPTQQPVEAEVGGQCLAPLVATSSKAPLDPSITQAGLYHHCAFACSRCTTNADCPAHDFCTTSPCF
jgi:hypothetical protein